MQKFNTSLITQGDRPGLPATVQLKRGRLSIVAGEEPIGDWDLREIQLQEIPTGYRMGVEGEQIVLEMTAHEAFSIELRRNSRRTRWGGPKPAPEEAASPPNKLIQGARRIGAAVWRQLRPLLPKWVFTRLMLGMVLGSLLLVLVFPALVSAFLLVSGTVLVVLSAAVYVQSILAERWLPGRTTPVDVLIVGVGVVVVGALLWVIS